MKEDIVKKSRTLRKNLTDTERFLWNYLRHRQLNGLKFRRQQPIGKYIVDFVCFEKRLIVELDGSQHNDMKHKDEERDNWLKAQGYRTLRFWNNVVFESVEAVLEEIRRYC